MTRPHRFRAGLAGGTHTGRPAVIARCSGTAEVVAAVNFAREHDLAVAVHGGGVAGLPTIGGGLLIDLSAMRGIQVDPERRLAHVQGGAQVGDVDQDIQVFGLATPLGAVSDTGVAGLTLDGGLGWLSRKYGLSCDNVVQAQVVCADGRVRTATEELHPDLYWAIRGGGGNFGIITSLTFRLHWVGPTVASTAPCYPLADVADVVRGWRDYLAGTPDEITSALMIVTIPEAPGFPEILHNRPCVIAAAVYSGDPEEGMQAMAPLRQLGTPLFDMSQPLPFTRVQRRFDALLVLQRQIDVGHAEFAGRDLVDLRPLTASPQLAPTSVPVVLGGAIDAVRGLHRRQVYRPRLRRPGYQLGPIRGLKASSRGPPGSPTPWNAICSGWSESRRSTTRRTSSGRTTTFCPARG